MKKLKLIAILTIAFLNSQISFGQAKVPLYVQKELEAAEAKMFKAILSYDMSYWKNNVHKDYVTINADGVMQTKEESMADYARKKMFAGMSYKLFDRKIRLYGNVAIINGRSQYIMGDKVLGEVYHTEIWIKEKGKWMFNGWQGTYAKGAQANLNPLGDSTEKEKLEQLSKAWMDAMIRHDTSTLKYLMAPEYKLQRWDGSTPVYLATWLDNLLNHIKIIKFEQSNIYAEIHGEVALVTSLYNWTGTFKNNPFDSKGYIVDTWVKNNNHWQVISRTNGTFAGSKTLDSK